MPRDPQELFDDIQKRCERIIRRTDELSKDEFFDDEWNVDASLYNLIVIGEAVKNLPDEVRTEHDEQIPFEAIAGARDIYAHECFRLNNDTLWGTLTEEVPELHEAIKTIR